MHLSIATQKNHRVAGFPNNWDVPTEQGLGWDIWVWEDGAYEKYTELKERVEQRLRDLDDTKSGEATRLFTLKLYLEYRAFRDYDWVI